MVALGPWSLVAPRLKMLVLPIRVEFCFVLFLKKLVLPIRLLLCLIFLLWDLCWFSWLFCETETIFGLTSFPDISRKTFINCLGCGFWLHGYKIKQTILFYYSWFHVFSNTRNEKKQLSMAVVLPPKTSVDLGFAWGHIEELKRFLPPPRRHFFWGLIFIFIFSCHSFWPSPSFPSFDQKRNNRGRLGKEGDEKQQKKENPCFIVSLFLDFYILLTFLVHIIFLWNSNWFYGREN